MSNLTAKCELSHHYVNVGGMGLLMNRRGDLAGLRGHEAQPLHFVGALPAPPMLTIQPDGAWTTQRLLDVLEAHAAQIGDLAPVNAMLGDMFLGSTEL